MESENKKYPVSYSNEQYHQLLETCPVDIGSTASTDSHEVEMNRLIEILNISYGLPSGTPETYGATPFSQLARPEAQAALYEGFRLLAKNSHNGSLEEEMIAYIDDTFDTRLYNRVKANSKNYFNALLTKEDYQDNSIIQQMIRRGEHGDANPTELLLLRSLLGMGSVEIACVTHPYGGERIKLLPKMRQALKSHVLLLGGQWNNFPEEIYKVKDIVDIPEVNKPPDLLKGLFMTRKRDLALMNDGTIIRERSSFVLRTDVLLEAHIGPVLDADPQSPTYFEDISKLGGLTTMATYFLEHNFFEFAPPISTTVYAFNRETKRNIKLRDEKILEDARKQREIRLSGLEL